MIDQVDCGNEVRKQYVPQHDQVLSVKKSKEVLQAEEGILEIAVSPENATATVKSNQCVE